MNKSNITRSGFVWLGLLVIVVLGIFWYTKVNPEEAMKRRDMELRSMLVGAWIQDTHYKPGYKVGDGGLREVQVWTFYPDGSFSSYSANNGSRLLSIALTGLGMKFKGRWYVYDQQLMTEMSGSNNPLVNTLESGKPYAAGTGKMKVENKDLFWLRGVPFYRKK